MSPSRSSIRDAIHLHTPKRIEIFSFAANWPVNAWLSLSATSPLAAEDKGALNITTVSFTGTGPL